jgi:hypothetical protein
MVRSGHSKGLERISFRSNFLILWWQKEEERRNFSIPHAKMLAVIRWTFVLRAFKRNII